MDLFVCSIVFKKYIFGKDFFPFHPIAPMRPSSGQPAIQLLALLWWGAPPASQPKFLARSQHPFGLLSGRRPRDAFPGGGVHQPFSSSESPYDDPPPRAELNRVPTQPKNRQILHSEKLILDPTAWPSKPVSRGQGRRTAPSLPQSFHLQNEKQGPIRWRRGRLLGSGQAEM